MKLEQVEEKAEGALLTCLSEVPFVEVQRVARERTGDGQRPDLLAELKLPDGRQLLVCEVKSSGEPRVARGAVNQLLRYRESFPGSYGVLIVPYVSPRTAEICTSEGIGYVDLAGNCRLSFGRVFIQRAGRLNRFARRRDLRSLYSPKAERVLRVLLSNPGRRWRIKDLAEEARVSLGQAFNVKKLLMDREWIGAGSDGFSLVEPAALLSEWAENYSYRRNAMREYYSRKSIAEVEAELAEVCARERIACALTDFSGAARVAPFVRYQRIAAYVGDDVERLASLLGLREVSSGANVSLWLPYDEGVFYAAQEYDDAPVVSPVQLYLDLRGIRGHGEEAASFLLEEVIRPRWSAAA